MIDELPEPPPIEGGINRVMEHESGLSVTRLEQTVDAASATLLAACYPSDTLVRRKAASTCSVIKIDYIGGLADLVESTGCTPETARWQLAAHCAGLVGELRNQGADTREGVLHTGWPANGLGLPITDEDDDAYQEA